MNNTITITGRLTKKAEIRTSEKGNKVASFTLAADQREGSLFIDVKAFGKTADVIESYTDKGKQVVVFGELNQRTYQNKDGINVRVNEILALGIQLLGSKNDTEKQPEVNQEKPKLDDLFDDDNLPF